MKKRSLYACGVSFVTLDKIPTWAEELREFKANGIYGRIIIINSITISIANSTANLENTEFNALGSPLNDNIRCDTVEYLPSTAINKKVSLWLGDITRLEIDLVSSVTSLAGIGSPGSVRYAVHEAAGPLLKKECKQLQDCMIPGDPMVTFGYNLPAKRKCTFTIINDSFMHIVHFSNTVVIH